jgi:hypothetical protein
MLLSEAVTEWLKQWQDGDDEALGRVAPVVYRDLRRLAASYLSHERSRPLQATELVHEAYLQVQKLDRVQWQSRAHFIAMTAGIMRRILVDHARQRMALKRGGPDAQPSDVNIESLGWETDPAMIRLEDSLDQFAKEFPRQAKVVELKFFGGLTTEEIAGVLGGDLTTRTIERDWHFARAWLRRDMSQA